MTEEENIDVQIEDTLEFDDQEQDSTEDFPVNQEFPGETDPQEIAEDPEGHNGISEIPDNEVDRQEDVGLQNTDHNQPEIEQQKTSPNPTRVMRFEDFIRDQS
jgi:hypothetical protein